MALRGREQEKILGIWTGDGVLQSCVSIIFAKQVLTKCLLSEERLQQTSNEVMDFFFFLAAPRSMQDVSSLSNPCPLQWKHGVLTTGPPGKFL